MAKARPRAVRASKQRILVMAHGHPDFSLGGGEIAAYNLYKAYRNLEEVDDAWFLARCDRNRGLTGCISLRRPNEYLWEQAVHDWHRMKAAHQDSLTTWFADLVRALRPTVVHAHHYAHFGLEYLRVIKQVDPSIRIVMTLHEYMAICSNNGQMIKTGTFRLCERATFDDCHKCFPNRSPEEFWLRKHYFSAHFDLVDQFVSPSEFLRKRYVDWGLDPARIVVIENGQSEETALPPRPVQDGELRNRVGYFGQINPYKGLDVLLQALTALPRRTRRNLVLEVHGANLEQQEQKYRDKVQELSAPLIDEGTLTWAGPYRAGELKQRMAGVDWVAVPSVWWENSPMVIQEALVYGRPLLVSNIGGMAEKVSDGVNGFHVEAGSVRAWSNTLSRLDDGLWNRCREGITRPLTYGDCARAHMPLLVQ